MKKLNVILAFFLSVVTFVANAQTDLPPNAKPGKCYSKCLIPDQFETSTEQVTVKPASSRTEVVPAVYETVTEKVEKKLHQQD
ncbi:MAG: hypothetical protein IPL95_04105 [Saprospiraceae bacterium]|nr:hypothetical protein [Saprospiraceae bacterium]